MTDEELMRYSRHILLPDIGVEGQTRINQAQVLIIGAGGLGTPAACYLAASGIGRITLVDSDAVDLTNLQRQILHTHERIGMPKAHSARIGLSTINPHTRVDALDQRIDAAALNRLVPEADVVLDCSDNFATRHAINRACVQHRTPLVSGAAIRFDGQLSVFDPRQAGTPCYACLFPEQAQGHSPDGTESVDDQDRCALMGVFAPLTGVIGCLQAAEALKLIVGFGKPLIGRLLLMDATTMQWRSIAVPKDPDCAVCGDVPSLPPSA